MLNIIKIIVIIMTKPIKKPPTRWRGLSLRPAGAPPGGGYGKRSSEEIEVRCPAWWTTMMGNVYGRRDV